MYQTTPPLLTLLVTSAACGGDVLTLNVECTSASDCTTPGDGEMLDGATCSFERCIYQQEQSACINDCSSIGETICETPSAVRTCGDHDSDSCLDWSEAQPCLSGNTCQADTGCPTACTDACIGTSDTQCAGVQIQTCSVGTGGCFKWDAAIDCPVTESCQGDTCVAGCADECIGSTDTQCSSTLIQTCSMGTSGCWEWDAPVACGGTNECQAGACDCVDECSSVQVRCDGTDAQDCRQGVDGCWDWTTTQSCVEGCDTGACCTHQCSPDGDKMCLSQESWECRGPTNGCRDWARNQTCGGGPNGGKCQSSTGNCCFNICGPPGALYCSGTRQLECQLLPIGCTDSWLCECLDWVQIGSC